MERSTLPSELIRDVQGQLAFEEENPRVWPVNHFPDAQINSASSALVRKHSTAFPTERILRQVRVLHSFVLFDLRVLDGVGDYRA